MGRNFAEKGLKLTKMPRHTAEHFLLSEQFADVLFVFFIRKFFDLLLCHRRAPLVFVVPQVWTSRLNFILFEEQLRDLSSLLIVRESDPR